MSDSLCNRLTFCHPDQVEGVNERDAKVFVIDTAGAAYGGAYFENVRLRHIPTFGPIKANDVVWVGSCDQYRNNR